jgi:hypothetical protein
MIDLENRNGSFTLNFWQNSLGRRTNKLMTKKQINRRRFLRGLGGSFLALPLLEVTAHSTGAAIPKRITATGIFYGLVPQHFHPAQVGSDFKAPRLLKSLELFRQDYTVFSGLDHNLGGGHNATKYFLTGIPSTQSKGFAEANVSVDQKAALRVVGKTRFPSLVLDTQGGNEHTLSWTRNGTPVQPIRSLSRLYHMLFGKEDVSSLNQAERDLADKRSILDLVRGQAKSFEKGLGKEDQEKLDQYFTSIRELEGRIEQSKLWLGTEKPKTNHTLPRRVDSLTLRDRTPFYYDLMKLALQTDSTRVITLAFTELGKEGGGLPGVESGYHALSHHGQVQDAIEELTIIESFHLTQFARFLGKLKEVKESNGKTLLDNTMALIGSGMSNANSHSNRDLPVILAGGGFKHGEHRHYARQGRSSVPLCNLFLSMLQNFGLEIDRFNTSSGTLTGLQLQG